MKRIILTMFIFTLIFSLNSITTESQLITTISNQFDVDLEPLDVSLQFTYEDHSYIDIWDDADLSHEASMGDGSIDDPYIIEGYRIMDEFMNGISIRDTTKCFTIRNCLISNSMSGIYIYNAGGAVINITNNILVTNNDCGIWIEDAQDVIVSDNNCSFNYDGVRIETSGNTLIQNNTCNFNQNSGISLRTPVVAEVVNNTCCNNLSGDGISISQNDISLLVQDNILCHNTNGYGLFSWDNGHDGTISGNSFTDNEYGIYLESTFECIFTENVFTNNTVDGAWINYCDDFTVTENIFSHNQQYGLKIRNTDRTEIHHNYFYDNYLGGTSQAYCEGLSNTWYDVATSQGNYWKGWYNGSYPIDGPSGYFDIYPLDLDPPSINSVDDVEYYYNSTGNVIQWNVTDLNPANFYVYRDFEEIVSGTWTNEDPLVINIDGLEVGEYLYLLFILDGEGRSSLDTVVVTVYPIINEFPSSLCVLLPMLLPIVVVINLLIKRIKLERLLE